MREARSRLRMPSWHALQRMHGVLWPLDDRSPLLRLVNPRRCTATVSWPGVATRLLDEGRTRDGAVVLPGVRLPLAGEGPGPGARGRPRLPSGRARAASAAVR